MESKELLNEMCYDCKFYPCQTLKNGGHCCTFNGLAEALEKQIPKIPDYEGDGYADGFLVYDTWICPSCGRHYEIDYDHYVYCPECGQRIDFDYGDE